MKDEFFNRLTMFQTTRDFLAAPLSKPVWEGKAPLIFGEKVADATAGVADLEDFCRRQGVVITGSAEDKDREETELEDSAFTNGKVLVDFHRTAGREAEAAKYDFSKTTWRRMRDNELLAAAKTVRMAIEALATGPQAAEAAKYDLTAATAAALQKEWEDYEKLVNTPATAISGKKGLTVQLRARFNAVSLKFESLDNLVGKFGTTPAGRDFVASYQAARIIRDAGSGGTPPAAAGGTIPAPK